MKTDLSKIRNLIFDLGNVLLDIHFDRTLPAFQKLGLKQGEVDYRIVAEEPLFRNLEVGLSTPNEFRNGIREFLNNPALGDCEIDNAWCAMLGSVKKSTVELLRELGKSYRLYLYSNTNAIHINKFLGDFNMKYGFDFQSMFTDVYYSHEIQDRKPEISSFYKVIERAGIKAEETLFIDDLEANCNAAEKAGLHSYHLKEGVSVVDLF